jgi:hypothetical protein
MENEFVLLPLDDSKVDCHGNNLCQLIRGQEHVTPNPDTSQSRKLRCTLHLFIFILWCAFRRLHALRRAMTTMAANQRLHHDVLCSLCSGRQYTASFMRLKLEYAPPAFPTE